MSYMVVPSPHAARVLSYAARRAGESAFKSTALGWKCSSCRSRFQRSFQTKAHQEGYNGAHSGSRMLQHEESLPRLPVPTLAETGERYLKSVQPYLNQTEMEKTRSIVNSFIEPLGPGAILQERLEQRRSSPDIKNWVAEWFNLAAYMAFRDPAYLTSYYFSFLDDPKRKDPVKRAAAISAAVLEFKHEVDEETLEPDYAKSIPLAMSAYSNVFNSCRVPARPHDLFEVYDPRENPHIVVMRKNMFFKVVHEFQGKRLTIAELEQQFQQVYALAGDENDELGVGILTSENRDIWSDARQRLIESKANQDALQTVQSASFVVCLDDAAPDNQNERARQYFFGNSSNRFFDKGVNFVVCDNGAAGYFGEHSLIDGAPVLRMVNYVLPRSMDLYPDPQAQESRDLPAPQRIEFELESPNLTDIEIAKAHFEAVKSQQKLHLELVDYGKKVIKSLKCPPDAYVQLLIQLAVRLFTGQTHPTYEAIGTRRFQLGRTETCRVVTTDSIAFCDSMVDSGSTNEMRRGLFKKALQTLVSMQEAASEGKGVDRHLFGLQHAVRRDEEMPAIFKDPVYTYSKTWFITSSQVSSEPCYGFGFAQTVPEGLGFSYMIKEDSMSMGISSQGADVELAGLFIAQAAKNIRGLMSGE